MNGVLVGSSPSHLLQGPCFAVAVSVSATAQEKGQLELLCCSPELLLSACRLDDTSYSRSHGSAWAQGSASAQPGHVRTSPAWLQQQRMPFASMTSGAGVVRPGQSSQPLFSLAELDLGMGRRAAMAAGAQDASAGAQHPSQLHAPQDQMLADALMASSSEENTDLELLAKAKCSLCHKRLGRSLGRILVCDGCHRVYHRQCCRHHGLDVPSRMADTGTWYHCQSCARASRAWQRQAAIGEQPLPTSSSSSSSSTEGDSGRFSSSNCSWQLVAVEPPSDAAGLRMGSAAAEARLEGLRDVATTVAGQYGPPMMGQLFRSDYGVLLRQRGLGASVSSSSGTGTYTGPLSAAVVDVLGSELALVGLLSAAGPGTANYTGSSSSSSSSSGALMGNGTGANKDNGGGDSEAEVVEMLRDSSLPALRYETTWALLGILSDFLPRAGTRSLLLALPSQDAKEAAVLGKPYGLQPLPRTRLAALKDEFPTIAAYSDTAFLVKDVPGASRAARLTGRDEGGLVSGEREREGGYGVSVSGWGRRLRGVVTLGLWR